MVFGKVLAGCSLALTLPEPAATAQPAWLQGILVLVRVAVLAALVLAVGELAAVQVVLPGARLGPEPLAREAPVVAPASAVRPAVRARDHRGAQLALVVVAREVAQLRAAAVAPVDLVLEVARSLVALVVVAARSAPVGGLPEEAGELALPVALRVEVALVPQVLVLEQVQAVAVVVQAAELLRVAAGAWVPARPVDPALFRVQVELPALLDPVPVLAAHQVLRVVAQVSAAQRPLRVQAVEVGVEVEVEGRAVEVLAPGARVQMSGWLQLCPAKTAIARGPTGMTPFTLPPMVRA